MRKLIGFIRLTYRCFCEAWRQAHCLELILRKLEKDMRNFNASN